MQTWSSGMVSPEFPINENFDTLAVFATYGKDPSNTTALVWGYYGGNYAGFSISDGTLTLTDASTNYIVVALADGSISVSTTSTNWLDGTNYRRVYKITTAAGLVTTVEDWRNGPSGIHGGGGTGPASIGRIPIACSDETTGLATGITTTFHMFGAITLSEVRASLTTAQATGSLFTVDILVNGTSILSTLITIDNTELSSFTAATAPVISSATIADDAKVQISITQIGDGTATGLKVYLIGAM